MYILESKNLIEITDDYKKKLLRLAKLDDSITGISSGFEKLDYITKGFQPSSLTIVGGAMGMGNTSFAISLVKKMAIENKYSTIFFSLKCTSEEFMTKIICQQTNIKLEKLRASSLNENETELVFSTMEQIKNAPLEFYDGAFITVDAIEEEAILFRHPDSIPKIIVIDSLQFIAKNKKDKVGKILNKREISQITFQLKELAEKHMISIILITEIQESKIKKTWNKRPRLMNMINYAPIANYADLILLLYRPEFYKIHQWDDGDAMPTIGQAEIIVAKNANGILDEIRVSFNGPKSEFDNLNE